MTCSSRKWKIQCLKIVKYYNIGPIKKGFPIQKCQYSFKCVHSWTQHLLHLCGVGGTAAISRWPCWDVREAQVALIVAFSSLQPSSLLLGLVSLIFLFRRVGWTIKQSNNMFSKNQPLVVLAPVGRRAGSRNQRLHNVFPQRETGSAW